MDILPAVWHGQGNQDNVPKVISTAFQRRNQLRSVDFPIVPTPIRIIAQIIMKAVREQMPTNASFFFSGILAFQTMFPGITMTRCDELSACSYRMWTARVKATWVVTQTGQALSR